MGIILSIIVVAILLYWIFPFESLFFYLLHLYCKFKTDKEIFHSAKVFGLKYNNDVTAVEKEIKREWNALSCIEIDIEHMTGKEAIELTRKRG